ncbi:MAG: hypothetical protein DCF31_16765 [Alphaproteobacteria bacterium]|nr:MAG: hypothetical protein DCF31_16765 [Alphaproteobacteria bacterium]
MATTGDIADDPVAEFAAPDVVAARRSGVSRWWRLAALVILAGFAVLAIDRLRERPAAVAPAARAEDPRDYAAALAAADAAVALGNKRTARAPQGWANHDMLARALLRRARLTGSFDDLARADAAATRGLAAAPQQARPALTAAIVAMAAQRLAAVEPLLQRHDAAAAPKTAADRAEAAALRGGLALYSGQYDAAAAGYTRAATLAPGGVLARQAALARGRGDLAAADAALRRALMAAAPGRQDRALLLLQRGGVALAAGRWDAAAALFAEAEGIFPGWWLVAAHRAQMLALRGDLEGANRAYRAIIGRTAQADPVVMDALAALCFERGDLPDGQVWAAQAAAVWERRLLQLPEASQAGAAAHALAAGDPARALDLARRNLAARPTGEAQLLLATVQLANGDAAAAVASVEALTAGGWRTATQYVVLADALALLDRGAESEAARQAALAINPKALDVTPSLLWFGAD